VYSHVGFTFISVGLYLCTYAFPIKGNCVSSFMILLIRCLFTARCTIVQSAVLQSHVICLSVCLPVCDVGGSWPHRLKILKTNCPTTLLFVAQRSSPFSQENMEKFWGENVRSTPTSTTSGWIESTESHVILGGGVAVCCLFTFAAHRALIFTIVQLSCSFRNFVATEVGQLCLF